MLSSRVRVQVSSHTDFLNHIISLIAAILFSAMGAIALPMEPSALHQAEFFQPQEVSVVEETSVHFAARAPPIVGADIVVTGAAVAEHGNGIIVHGHETHAASLGFGVGFDATNRTLPNGSPYSQADYDAYVRRKSDAGETPRSLEDYVQRRQQLDQNRADGTRRQEQYRQEMADIYGEENVLTERYLRDADGDIVRDPQTGEARRLDCVVVNGQCGTFTSEVTSPTANKVDQIAKEERIREQGGTFVENPNTGELIEVPISNIERME